MLFILNLTLREIRSSWRRLLFFFICIGIGVGSIVALRSLIQNLNRSLAGEARSFMTADFEINSTSPFTTAETEAVERLIDDSKIIEARNETLQTTTMSRPTDLANQTAQIIELKGVENGFPLVGNFLLSDGKPFDGKLLEKRGAIVHELLLDRLGIKIGDKFRVGTKDFEIRGTFNQEPGDVGGFRLGPRVFIEKKAFDEAGLTAFGARNRRKILFRTADNPEFLVRNLRSALKQINSVVQVRSYRESQTDIAESFDRAENFLSLTGLVILVLGGIGVWNVTRVFVAQKKKTIAILKCLGGTGNRVISAYLLQVLSLGLMGSLLGIILAQTALWFVQARFAASLPTQMSYGLQFSAILQGLLLGILVSLLFSALPLLQIRKIKPNLLLRDETSNSGQSAVSSYQKVFLFWRNTDFLNILIAVVVSSGLLLLAVWQANSWKVGTYFLLGLGLTAGILYFFAAVLTKFLHLFRAVPNFAVRQSINSLYRPGNQTRVILLAVGLGVFVVLAVQSLQVNLLREFDLTRGGSLPSLLLIDVQRRQVDAVKKLIKDEIGEDVNPIPTVRGKISAIDGQVPDFDKLPTRQNQGQLGREYVLSYRGALVGEEKIVAGKFWENSPSDEPEISVDESLRGLQGLDVGSIVTFDILGQKINAKVTSIRNLDVRDTRGTFLILFRPGVLEDAPTSFLTPILTNASGAERTKLQRKLFDQFPNVSAIDTTEAIASIRKLINNIVLAISFVGFFVILSGILILVGSISLTKFQRIYENAILKTLGAKRWLLIFILIGEYGVLGFVAGIIGASAAVILSYLVAHFVLDIKWQFDFRQTLSGLVLTILLVTLVGVISSFDVLFRKPLATLRLQ